MRHALIPIRVEVHCVNDTVPTFGYLPYLSHVYLQREGLFVQIDAYPS